MTSADARIQKHLARCIGNWPGRAAIALNGYFSRGARTSGRTRLRAGHPIWLSLPEWLVAKYRAPATTQAFLDDIQWGQYCLFLFVRIHDDLFDAHAADPALIYVADLLLIQSQEAFARRISGSLFWRFYRESLSTTLGGVLEVDRIQRRPRGMRDGDGWAHARVSTIFKVGAAAVCYRAGRARDLPRLSAYADRIAIASQTLDDLSDIDQDLRTGRLNYAASALLRGTHRQTQHRKTPPRVVARQITTEGADVILAGMRQHLKAALAAIEPLKLWQAERYAKRMLSDVSVLEAGVHQMRVRAVFGSVPGARS
jgi:hypothetical protein